jgi:hypothetical protein
MAKHPTSPPAYAARIADLAALLALHRRLEIHALRLMKDAGITDEAIGIEMNISGQAAGRKAKRKV